MNRAIDASEGCEAWGDEGEPGGRHRARGVTLGYSVPVPPPSRPG